MGIKPSLYMLQQRWGAAPALNPMPLSSHVVKTLPLAWAAGRLSLFSWEGGAAEAL